MGGRGAGRVELEPGGVLGWVLIGLVAGWLASTMTRGRGFGCLGNIAIGLAGAVIGGFLFTLLGFDGTVGLLGSIVIASIGAALLLILLNTLSGRAI
jgi:uncharacterized membrane protein YeaQ/YmgE (transglycosylase-associated protein family)